MRYIVTVREVWTNGVDIEAPDELTAIKMVDKGLGTTVDGLFEFSHFMDKSKYTVEEAPLPVEPDEDSQSDGTQKKSKYVVSKQSVWTDDVLVEADSKEHAVSLAAAGIGTPDGSGRLFLREEDPSKWGVRSDEDLLSLKKEFKDCRELLSVMVRECKEREAENINMWYVENQLRFLIDSFGSAQLVARLVRERLTKKEDQNTSGGTNGT